MIKSAIKTHSYTASTAKKNLIKGKAALVIRTIFEIIAVVGALFFLVGSVSVFASHDIGVGIVYLILTVVVAIFAITNGNRIGEIKKENKIREDAIAREAELAIELQEAERKLAEAERKLDNFR